MERSFPAAGAIAGALPGFMAARIQGFGTRVAGLSRPFLFLFMLLGPWSVTALNKPLLVLLFLCAAAFLVLRIVQSGTLSLDLMSRAVILTYALAFLAGLLALLLSVEEIQGRYLSSVVPGRLFTLTAICLTLVIALDAVNSTPPVSMPFFLKTALASLCLFIAGALWQLADIWLGIPFPFETRDWMHGVPDPLRETLPRRVTSFAEEPNFLAPLLMEYLLLVRLLVGSVVVRNALLALGVGVTMLTFSGGAYANLLILVLLLGFLRFLDFLATYRFRLSHLLLIAALLLVSAYVLIVVFDSLVFEYAAAKFTRETTGGSSRSIFLAALTQLWLDSDPARMLFGHGIATMSILPDFGLAPDHFLFRIANNFYLDILWESGLVGLVLVLTLLFVLLRVGWVNRRCNRAYETGFLLAAHLAVTSLYRSEYLSSHFAWVILLILCCYALGAHLKPKPCYVP